MQHQTIAGTTRRAQYELGLTINFLLGVLNLSLMLWSIFRILSWASRRPLGDTLFQLILRGK